MCVLSGPPCCRFRCTWVMTVPSPMFKIQKFGYSPLVGFLNACCPHNASHSPCSKKHKYSQMQRIWVRIRKTRLQAFVQSLPKFVLPPVAQWISTYARDLNRNPSPTPPWQMTLNVKTCSVVQQALTNRRGRHHLN